MIIECIKCSKKFDVDSELIPNEGRTIQCGACEHIWFFNKNDQKIIEKDEEKIIKKNDSKKLETKIKKRNKEKIINSIKNLPNKKQALVKYQEKSSFSFGKFLSYILVAIISFIAMIIVLDTFKSPLSIYFTNLEYFLDNFYETIKDITLFLINLIND
tara:strand:+ start:333 stop:806 length:474 start_codon:yes stop_codon:yes gene_type:complete